MSFNKFLQHTQIEFPVPSRLLVSATSIAWPLLYCLAPGLAWAVLGCVSQCALSEERVAYKNMDTLKNTGPRTRRNASYVLQMVNNCFST